MCGAGFPLNAAHQYWIDTDLLFFLHLLSDYQGILFRHLHYYKTVKNTLFFLFYACFLRFNKIDTLYL